MARRISNRNAACGAGQAAALVKALITLHQPALKELDAAALAMIQTPEQVAHILRYTLIGTLPR